MALVSIRLHRQLAIFLDKHTFDTYNEFFGVRYGYCRKNRAPHIIWKSCKIFEEKAYTYWIP